MVTEGGAELVIEQMNSPVHHASNMQRKILELPRKIFAAILPFILALHGCICHCEAEYSLDTFIYAAGKK